MVSYVVDPEVFIIGGGVSNAGDYLIEMIQKLYEPYITLSQKKRKSFGLLWETTPEFMERPGWFFGRKKTACFRAGVKQEEKSMTDHTKLIMHREEVRVSDKELLKGILDLTSVCCVGFQDEPYPYMSHELWLRMGR